MRHWASCSTILPSPCRSRTGASPPPSPTGACRSLRAALTPLPPSAPPSLPSCLAATALDAPADPAQTSYIVPFGFNIVVVMCTGFFLNRYDFMPRSFARPLKYLCAFNLFWYVTVGLYMPFAQVLGYDGAFGLVSPAAPGEIEGDPAQNWFRQFNVVVLGLSSQQALFDYINFKALRECLEPQKIGTPAATLASKPNSWPPVQVLDTMLASGNSVLSWKDMHKWSMLDLSFQAFAIFGAFFAYFPFCLWEGFPDWRSPAAYLLPSTSLSTPTPTPISHRSCVSEIPYAVPIIGVFFVPMLPQLPWTCAPRTPLAAQVRSGANTLEACRAGVARRPLHQGGAGRQAPGVLSGVARVGQG
jgi:hypothetical protein